MFTNNIESFGVDFKITYEHIGESDKLTITYPMDLWSDAISAMEDIRKCIADKKWSEEYSSKAVDMLVFMMVFDWIKEYPMKPIIDIIGTSTAGFTWAVKYLEGSRLVFIDRSLTNEVDKRPYQWYVNKDMIKSDSYDYSSTTTSVYDISGTVFSSLFRKYEYSLKNPVFEPKKSGRNFTGDDEPVPEDLPYKSDYSLLTYRYSGKNFKENLFESYCVDLYVSKLGVEPVYKSGRIYNAFHNIPKKLRHNLEYNGSPLTELFDLHCSFYTLSVGMILDKFENINPEDLESFYDTCFSGKLYENLADEIGCTRDEAKEKLQGWRNCWRYGALHFEKFGYSDVSGYMETNYPVLSNIYYNWEKRKNKYNKIVKNLQYDACVFETQIISKLATWINSEYGITCFCLHDAIYVSEEEKMRLPVNIDKKIASWFRRELLTKYKK